jgi:hypothetical protein
MAGTGARLLTIIELSTPSQKRGRAIKLRQMLNWAGLVIALAVRGLANALPLVGKTTGEISNNMPTMFTPAGHIFSI